MAGSERSGFLKRVGLACTGSLIKKKVNNGLCEHTHQKVQFCMLVYSVERKSLQKIQDNAYLYYQSRLK